MHFLVNNTTALAVIKLSLARGRRGEIATVIYITNKNYTSHWNIKWKIL
jgi:hypothetical protein